MYILIYIKGSKFLQTAIYTYNHLILLVNITSLSLLFTITIFFREQIQLSFSSYPQKSFTEKETSYYTEELLLG